MNLTGRDVHKAFVTAFPYLAPNWYILPDTSKEGYDLIASELNKLVKERNDAHDQEVDAPAEEKD
jgi:hypothetical protein